MAMIITFDLHWYRHSNKDNPQAQVKVNDLGSGYIVQGKSTIAVNFVVVLEKQSSDTPLTCVNVVKASIQVTEMSVCQSTSKKFCVQ